VATETETRRQAIRVEAERYRSAAEAEGHKFKLQGGRWHKASLFLAWGAATLAALSGLSLLTEMEGRVP